MAATAIPTSEPAFAPANGITLCYQTFGSPNDAPLVLVMGLATQMIVWEDDFCRELAARGFYVVRFDNRDCGESTHVENVGRRRARYSLRDMAADTVGLMDALGVRRAHVVGASMGGAIAQELAIHFRERVATLTCMMSSSGDPRLPLPTPAALGVLFSRPSRTREHYLESYVRRWHILTGPVFPFDAERLRRQGERSYARGYDPAGASRQLAAIVRSGNRKRALRRLDVPALVIHGTLDPLIRFKAALDLCDAIHGATLLAVEGMGHTLPRATWPRVIAAIATIAERATPCPSASERGSRSS